MHALPSCFPALNSSVLSHITSLSKSNTSQASKVSSREQDTIPRADLCYATQNNFPDTFDRIGGVSSVSSFSPNKTIVIAKENRVRVIESELDWVQSNHRELVNHRTVADG